MSAPITSSFRTTRWSVVFAANGDGEAAEVFCQAYWYPLYAFARRSGKAHHDAQDTVQGFLSHLFERGVLDQVHPENGKLRTYLLRSLKNSMSNAWRDSRALKRGGANEHVALHDVVGDWEARYESLEATDTPDSLYDKCWAEALFESARGRLRAAYQSDGKGALAKVLERYLVHDAEELPYAETAPAAGVKPDTLRVAVHRYRQRFGAVLREEIERTVESSTEAEEEILTLFGVVDAL